MSYTAISPTSQLALYQHGPAPAGFGEYENVGNWTWERNGIVYAGMDPADSAAQPAPTLGMGGCGCHGKCGGSGGCGDHAHGMGQATGLFGSSLFSSSDISQWGALEWLCVGGAVYLALSLLGDVKGVASGVSKSRRKSATRARRRARAQADLF